MSKHELSKLSRMIEDALDVALQMDEATTAYLLSMASFEVTGKLEATGSNPSDRG